MRAHGADTGIYSSMVGERFVGERREPAPLAGGEDQ